jgi:hypothetical protein
LAASSPYQSTRTAPFDFRNDFRSRSIATGRLPLGRTRRPLWPENQLDSNAKSGGSCFSPLPWRMARMGRRLVRRRRIGRLDPVPG